MWQAFGCVAVRSRRIGQLVRLVQAQSVCRVACPARPCCLIVTRGLAFERNKPAACHSLEPRPTNAVEDDDEYEDDGVKRQTLPQPFALLQHSFGDLADLAGSQEREMQQLEQ